MDELPGPYQSTSNETDLSMQHIGRGMRPSSYSTLPDNELLPDISKIIIESGRRGPSHDKMGQPLCQICFGLDEAAFKDETNYSMQWSLFIERSKPAVEHQCKSCSLLRGSISQFEPLWVENPFEVPHSQVLSRDGRTVPERVNVSATAEDGLIVSFRSLKLELYRRLDSSSRWKISRLMRSSSPWKMIQERPHVPQDSQSNETYRSVCRWLSDCINNHRKCPPNINVPLPSRVIDVKNIETLKLYVTASEKGRYVALSHRWGASALTTILANFQSRKKCIRWTELPKIFQDAIAITRQLGLRYLWIDSLCIIQDDIEDWQRQSAQMASIYANSYVTIGATSSDSSDSTCLSLTNRARAPVEFNQPSIFARKALSHGHMFNPNENNPAYPLFGRAWCFQERLLSTRTLHYTRDEIVFECRTGYRCECGSIWSGVQPAVSNCLKLAYAQILEESRKFGDGDRYTGPTLTSSCNKETLLWFRILGEYTATQISFDRDTLPALSGVADKMPLDLMGKYLAGLWEQNLLYGLLWRSQDGLKCRRHHIYVAPSFSWASRSGPITFPHFTSRYGVSAKVAEVECQPVGFNATGEVSGGFVKLRGSVVAVQFTKTSKDPVSCVMHKGSSAKATIIIDSREALYIEDGTVVHCLSILHYGRLNAHYALVLMESIFHPGDFERIGMANDVPGEWFRDATYREVTIV